MHISNTSLNPIHTSRYLYETFFFLHSCFSHQGVSRWDRTLLLSGVALLWMMTETAIFPGAFESGSTRLKNTPSVQSSLWPPVTICRYVPSTSYTTPHPINVGMCSHSNLVLAKLYEQIVPYLLSSEYHTPPTACWV